MQDISIEYSSQDYLMDYLARILDRDRGMAAVFIPRVVMRMITLCMVIPPRVLHVCGHAGHVVDVFWTDDAALLFAAGRTLRAVPPSSLHLIPSTGRILGSTSHSVRGLCTPNS